MKEYSRERSFGRSVGAVLCAIAAYQLWRGRFELAAAVGVVGTSLVGLGALAPRLLVRPADWWWRVAHLLGYINTRVLLTLVFFALLMPMGLLWRVIGRDPLGRRRTSWVGWTKYPARYADPAHYRRMF